MVPGCASALQLTQLSTWPSSPTPGKFPNPSSAPSQAPSRLLGSEQGIGELAHDARRETAQRAERIAHQLRVREQGNGRRREERIGRFRSQRLARALDVAGQYVADERDQWVFRRPRRLVPFRRLHPGGFGRAGLLLLLPHAEGVNLGQ